MGQYHTGDKGRASAQLTMKEVEMKRKINHIFHMFSNGIPSYGEFFAKKI